MSLSFFLISYRKLKNTFHYEVEWPYLTIVSMTRELYINTIFLCFREFFWLMIEEYEWFVFVCAFQNFREFFSLSTKTRRTRIISTNNDDSRHFNRIVLEYRDIMITEIFSCSLHSSDIFMISCDAVGTIH